MASSMTSAAVRRVRLLSMLVAGASALALVVPAAVAQTASVGLEEIVVTAQKRAENVQEVPIAISAVTGEFIDSRDISSIDRLGSLAPNVKIERAPSSKTISQISIRGSVTINPAITWEPAVGLYLDGIYIAKAQGSIFDVADLERIEVLRGPQGTLYGRNTLAGAVNLITKKPSGELGGSFTATYGNYDQWKLGGSLDLPKFGIFSAKISGEIKKRDGFVKVVPNTVPNVFLAGPPAVDEVSNLDGKSGLVQLRAEPSDWLTVDYMFDISEYDQQPDYAQLVHINRNGDPRDIFDPNSPGYPFGGLYFPLDLYENSKRQTVASLDADPHREYSRTWGHALTIEADLGSAVLKSITSYRDLKWQDNLDLDGSPLPVAFTQRFTDYDAFSQELQLAGDAGRLNYVVGLYYFDDSAYTSNPQRFFAGGAVYDSRYGSDTTAFAAYSQFDFSLTDQITLTGGLRYTHEKKDIERYFAILADSAIDPEYLPLTVLDVAKGDVPDAKYNTMTPSFVVRYEPHKGLNVYAKYARGFKSGGFNGETSSIDELLQPYDPEKVDSYEVGMKSRLLDGRLQLNLAAFWDEHKDIQLSVFTGRNAAESFVLNAARARIRGLEIESTMKPSDNLLVSAAFAYLDAKYLSYIDGGVDVSDNRAFPHTPKYTASVSADWTAWQGDMGKLNLIADMSFVSKYYTYPYALRTEAASDQIASNTRSQGRTIVDLRATLSEIPVGSAEAKVSLWVRNLFKEDNPQNFIDFGPNFGGLTVGYFPDPRTYGLTVGVNF